MTEKSGLDIQFADQKTKGATTYLHVGSALPTGGAWQAIFRSRQKKQAITGLHRALRFVDGNFNTPCPALGLGANGANACEGLVAPKSTRCTLDVGVTISDDEKDEERSVWIRVLGE